MEEHYLYRHFNSKNELLYVGVSFRLLRRISDHRRDSYWFPEIQNITLEKFNSRQDALKAETEAIQKEKPIHNIHKTRISPHSVGIYDLMNQSRALTNRRVVAFNPIYEISELTSVLPLTPKQINELIDKGELGFIELPNKINTKMKRYITGWQLIDFLEYIQLKQEKIKI